jgi:hypothetical protein
MTNLVDVMEIEELGHLADFLEGPSDVTPYAQEFNSLTGAELMDLVLEDWFENKKDFCDALGIGESTLSGWLKAGHFPQMAALIVGLLFCIKERNSERVCFKNRLNDANKNSRLVRDGDGFIIVEFKDSLVGKIIARDIPDEKTGQTLISHHNLKELLRFLHSHISNPNEDDIARGYDTHLLGMIEGALQDQATNEEESKDIKGDIDE